jgi:hypothetical protein
MVSIAQASGFPHHRHFPLLERFNAEIEEWVSVESVTPLVRLQVTPEDFPYLDKVQFRL